MLVLLLVGEKGINERKLPLSKGEPLQEQKHRRGVGGKVAYERMGAAVAAAANQFALCFELFFKGRELVLSHQTMLTCSFPCSRRSGSMAAAFSAPGTAKIIWSTACRQMIMRPRKGRWVASHGSSNYNRLCLPSKENLGLTWDQ